MNQTKNTFRMEHKMLRIPAVAALLSTLVVVSFSLSAQQFSPSAQQINQFKNLPRAQQEALAKQAGINLSDFTQGSTADDSSGGQKQPDTQVERTVNERAIADTLAQQSATKALTSKLKPFGYSLFGSNNENGANVSFAPANNTPVPADYVMGPGDSINVQLFGKKTGKFELFVNNEGAIQIPELGPVSVVGLQYSELKAQLIEKYQQQVIGVTPHITMGTLRTIQVYLVGEAFRPGAYTLSSLSTITHALFASGGVNEIGSLRNIQLKRSGQTLVNFDLYDLLVFGDTSKDKRLQQGDVIFIPPVKKLVSLNGNIRRPAIYEVKEHETLQQVVSIAGGLLPSGASNMVQIARKTIQSGLEIKTVDLSSPSTANFLLSSGDYINIPNANDQFASGVIIAGAYSNPGMMQWRQGLSLSTVITSQSILSDTDLDYALVVRKSKFATSSQVFQFSPASVMSGEFDLVLQNYDHILLFNRSGLDLDAQGEVNEEEDPLDGDELSVANERIDVKNENYLNNLKGSSFSDRQLVLTETQYYSRKQLLAPIISRLKQEATTANPAQLAKVTGEVKHPGVYPIAINGSVKHLIEAAGGLSESAYTVRAELSRIALDSEQSFKVEHISVSLTEVLSGSGQSNITLKSKDTLNVAQAPDWFDNRKVELFGEVVFPGVYQIKKNETLSQLIARAGGFTDAASPKAAIFTREELREREKANIDKTVETLKQQIIASNVSGSQNVKAIDYGEAKIILDELLSVEPIGRLVINLADVLDDSKKSDLQLKNGDKLYIPSISPSVSVIGEVFVPTTHIIDEALTLNQYIELSGGFTERADNSNVYIVRADGSVSIPNENFWFGRASAQLEPGDTIVVPRDVVNYERLGLWQTVTQIFYQSAIALIAIGNL